jgi:RNA polymerase sigma-70 factor (ECF subfamily)
MTQVDEDTAFRELTAPYRRELLVHCYRMLGSLQDAEDVLQDVLLAAWQGMGAFEGRSSLRTWLYRIATNRCLNARRAAARRPPRAWDVPGVDLLEPSSLGEVVWLEPFPDALLGPSPEARYERTESISLAFVTALQVLPHRQVAVLLLRDVLGFPAREVAEMLDTSVDSVTSALKRARAGLRAARPPGTPTAGDDALVARFVSAYESPDVVALVALLTDDVFISMPPMPYEYVGRELAARFCAGILGGGRRFELVATGANGQPAFVTYLRASDGSRRATGLLVLTLDGGRVAALTRFDEAVLSGFATG